MDAVVRPIALADVEGFRACVHAHVGHLGMGIAAAWRGRGLGECLMRATLDAPRAAGFEKIELSVFATNMRARALYEKLGFALEGTRVRGRKVDGEYDDVHMMGRIFEP